jgi:hypothetical protein
VNPTDYREPLPHYNEDEEDEVESHLTRYPMCI